MICQLCCAKTIQRIFTAEKGSDNDQLNIKRSGAFETEARTEPGTYQLLDSNLEPMMLSPLAGS